MQNHFEHEECQSGGHLTYYLGGEKTNNLVNMCIQLAKKLQGI